MYYERKVLVPYLENLCFLQMTANALLAKQDRYQRWCNTEENYTRNYEVPDELVKPQKEHRRAFWIGVAKGLGIACICTIGIFLFIFFLFFLGDLANSILKYIGIHSSMRESYGREICLAFALVSVVMTAIILVCCVIREKGIMNRNYRGEIEEYNRDVEQLETYKNYQNILPYHREVVEKCKIEYDKVKELLDEAYSVNIIPNRYRNVYAVSYLYDYFSSSNADDLDAIIQTLLLDNIQQELQKIQAKLDQIINNQDNMIPVLQNICSKAGRIERNIKRNGERQLRAYADQERYLDIIEANTRASAYFSAATCIEVMNL